MGRLVANQGNKGRPFRLALPKADSSGNSADKYRKITKISPGHIFPSPFLRGLSTERKLRFRIDWASLIVGSKFTVFALFYFEFAGNFSNTSPLGAYIWRGNLTAGFYVTSLGGGRIFGEAYFRNFSVVINASKENRRAQIAFFFFSPAIFHSFSILLFLGTTRTEISAWKPNVNLFRLLESS